MSVDYLLAGLYPLLCKLARMFLNAKLPTGRVVTDRANGGLAGVGVSGGGDLLGSVTGNTSLLRGRAIESLSRVGKMSVSRRDEDAR